jgi:hypothetical protein
MLPLGTEPFGYIDIESVAVEDSDQALFVGVIGDIGVMARLGWEDQDWAFGVEVLIGKTPQTQVLMFIDHLIGGGPIRIGAGKLSKYFHEFGLKCVTLIYIHCNEPPYSGA